MKRPSRSCLVLLFAGLLGGTGATAWAQDPPAAPAPAAMAPEPAASPMAMPRKFTGDQEAFFISGGAGDNAYWTIGTTLPVGVTISVGLNFTYNSTGLPTGPTTPPSTDKVAFNGVLYGAYYFYNKFPVGIAAEAAVIAQLAPATATGTPTATVQPGVGIFYAPFPAPIVLGSALDLQISFIKDKGTVVNTVTPGLRIVYVF